MAEVQHTTDHTNMPGNHTEDTNCIPTKLIINYLPHCMSQKELYQLFSTAGEVESCVLMCDKTTFESLCFGFVEYFQPEHAAKAIKTFQGLKILNKTLKVSYARPSNKAIMKANLYVQGFPKEFTIADLQKLFSPFGKIIDSRILCNEIENNCFSKQVGFVRFNTRAEAEEAMEKLNGAILGDKPPLVVKFAAPAGNREFYQQHSVTPLRDQHYGGQYMKFNTNGMHLTPQPQFGYNTRIPINQYSGKAYPMQPNVQYSSAHAPYTFMQATNSQMATETNVPQNYNSMQGAPLVHSQLPGYDTMNNLGRSLFVANFPPDVNENALGWLFSNHGNVVKVKIIRHTSSPAYKDYAFVTMANNFHAEAAIHGLDGYNINGFSLRVTFQSKSGPRKN